VYGKLIAKSKEDDAKTAIAANLLLQQEIRPVNWLNWPALKEVCACGFLGQLVRTLS